MGSAYGRMVLGTSVCVGVCVVSQFVFKNIFRRSSPEVHTSSLVMASSYYLPEGRYYEAPLVLKRKPQRGKFVLPVMLGAGLSIANISSLQRQTDGPFVSANTTVLMRSLNDEPTRVVRADVVTVKVSEPVIDKMTTASIAYNGKNLIEEAQPKRGIHAKSPDEERINRAAKSALAARAVNRDGLLLAAYQPERVNIPVPQGKPDTSYIAKLVPSEKSQQPAQPVQIAEATIPVPKAKSVPTLEVPATLASLVTNNKPDVLALGYAPAEAAKMKQTPFDSILTDEQKQATGRFIPPIGKKDHAWAANPLPPSAFSAKEQKCLAEAVYFEARGESLKGQAAVAQVVLNRVRNPTYPATICGVVYQNVKWRNRCQFSFACDGKRHRVTEKRHWRNAQDVAKAVSAGQIWLSEVGSATHYHAVYVRPRWARTMYRVDKIGLHIFYRTRNGGWS